MGVRDFVCFIQRNGQCVSELVTTEEEVEYHADCCGPGSDEPCDVAATYPPCGQDIDTEGDVRAIIITMPASMRGEIETLPLWRFREYPAVAEDYSWDGWDFEGPHGDTGYNDVLMGNLANIDRDWPNESLWIVGDEMYVVMQIEYYNMFVLGDDPEAISWYTYAEIFDNRGSDVPRMKSAAWDIIVNGSTSRIPVISFHTPTGARPTWKQRYTGTAPPGYTVARLGVLVRIKNIHCSAIALDRGQFSFTAEFSIDLPYFDTDGCIVCGGRRVMDTNVCGEHEDTEEGREHRWEESRVYARAYDATCEQWAQPPNTLTASFTDKGVDHMIVFTAC